MQHGIIPLLHSIRMLSWFAPKIVLVFIMNEMKTMCAFCSIFGSCVYMWPFPQSHLRNVTLEGNHFKVNHLQGPSNFIVSRTYLKYKEVRFFSLHEALLSPRSGPCYILLTRKKSNKQMLCYFISNVWWLLLLICPDCRNSYGGDIIILEF